MPKPARTPRFPFKSYQHLLTVLTGGAMTVVERIPEEASRDLADPSPRTGLSPIVRNFAVVSSLVCRSIVVSRYIESLPVPTEEREHRLGPALDRVFRLFAARKMTVEEYNRAVDAELDGALEDEAEDEFDGDDEEHEFDPEAEVLGRPPSALVAELCRDFGMIAHSVPAEWLEPVPAELRLLCARAAAAAIRPSGPPLRVGSAVRR